MQPCFLYVWVDVLKLKSGFAVLFFFAGEPLGGKSAAGVPRGYWSFSWVAEDDLSTASNSTSGEQEADGPPSEWQRGKHAPVLRSRFPHAMSHSLSVNTHGLLCPARPLFFSPGIVTKPHVSHRDCIHNMVTTFNQSAAWQKGAGVITLPQCVIEINSWFPLTLLPIK